MTTAHIKKNSNIVFEYSKQNIIFATNQIPTFMKRKELYDKLPNGMYVQWNKAMPWSACFFGAKTTRTMKEADFTHSHPLSAKYIA